MRVHREEKRGKGNRRGKEQNRKEKGKEEKKGKESKEEEEDNLGGDIDGDDVLHAFKRKHKDRSIATGEPAPSLLPPPSADFTGRPTAGMTTTRRGPLSSRGEPARSVRTLRSRARSRNPGSV